MLYVQEKKNSDHIFCYRYYANFRKYFFISGSIFSDIEKIKIFTIVRFIFFGSHNFAFIPMRDIMIPSKLNSTSIYEMAYEIEILLIIRDDRSN